MNEDKTDDLVVNALATYLESSLDQERSLRDILAKAGYDSAELPLEDCLTNLVRDYLRLRAS